MHASETVSLDWEKWCELRKLYPKLGKSALVQKAVAELLNRTKGEYAQKIAEGASFR